MPLLTPELNQQKLKLALGRIGGQVDVGLQRADVADLESQLVEIPGAENYSTEGYDFGATTSLLARLRAQRAARTERSGVHIDMGEAGGASTPELRDANERLARAVANAARAGDYESAKAYSEEGEEPGFLNKALGWLDTLSAYVQGVITADYGADTDQGFFEGMVSDIAEGNRAGLSNAAKAARGEDFQRVFEGENEEGELGAGGLTKEVGSDILFDPMTYLTFGLSGLGKAAAAKGSKFLRVTADVIEEGVEAGVKAGAKRGTKEAVREALRRKGAAEAISRGSGGLADFAPSVADDLSEATDLTRGLSKKGARRFEREVNDVGRFIDRLASRGISVDPPTLREWANTLDKASEMARRRGPVKSALRGIAEESPAGKAAVNALPTAASSGIKVQLPFMERGWRLTKGTKVSGKLSDALSNTGIPQALEKKFDYWNELRQAVDKGVLSGEQFRQTRDIIRRASVNQGNLETQSAIAAQLVARGFKAAGLEGRDAIRLIEEVGQRPLEQAADAVRDLTGRLVAKGVDEKLARETAEAWGFFRYRLLEEFAVAGGDINELLGHFPHAISKSKRGRKLAERIREYNLDKARTSVPDRGAAPFGVGPAKERTILGDIGTINDWSTEVLGEPMFTEDLQEAYGILGRALARGVSRHGALTEMLEKGVAEKTGFEIVEEVWSEANPKRAAKGERALKAVTNAARVTTSKREAQGELRKTGGKGAAIAQELVHDIRKAQGAVAGGSPKERALAAAKAHADYNKRLPKDFAAARSRLATSPSRTRYSNSLASTAKKLGWDPRDVERAMLIEDVLAFNAARFSPKKFPTADSWFEKRITSGDPSKLSPGSLKKVTKKQAEKNADTFVNSKHTVNVGDDWSEGMFLGPGGQLWRGKDKHLIHAELATRVLLGEEHIGGTLSALGDMIDSGFIRVGLGEPFNDESYGRAMFLQVGNNKQLTDAQYRAVQKGIKDFEVDEVYIDATHGNGEILSRASAGRVRQIFERLNQGERRITLAKKRPGKWADEDSVLGAVSFSKEGRATIQLFKDADLTVLVHENAHVLRRVLPKGDMDALERAYKVKNGAWTRANEERFAKDVEKYFTAGKAPSPELQTVFERVRTLMRTVWQALKDDKRLGLKPEVKATLDKWFSVPDNKVLQSVLETARPKVDEVVQPELKRVGGKLPRVPAQAPLSELEAQLIPAVERAQARLDEHVAKGRIGPQMEREVRRVLNDPHSRHVAEEVATLLEEKTKEAAELAARVAKAARNEAKAVAAMQKAVGNALGTPPEVIKAKTKKIPLLVPEGYREARKAFGTKPGVAIPRHVEDMFKNVLDFYEDPGAAGRLIDGFMKMWRSWAVSTPGFVLRNAYGILWQNFALAGVSPKAAVRAWKMLGGDFGTTARRTGKSAGPLSAALRAAGGGGKKAERLMAEAATHGVIDKNFFESIRNVASLPPDDISRLWKVDLNPFSSDNFVTRTIFKGQQAVENWARLSVFVDAVENRGMSFADAADRSHFFHFAYDELRPGEVKWGKRGMSFYTWTKNNMVLQFQDFARKPAKLMAVDRAREARERQTGRSVGSEALGAYSKLQFAVPLWGRFFLAQDMPYADLNKLPGSLNDLLDPDVSDYMSPPLKFFIDVVSGKRPFERSPVWKDVEAPDWAKVPAVRQLFEKMGAVHANPRTGTIYIDSAWKARVEELFPPLKRWSDLSPEDRDSKERWLQRMFSMFGGLGVRYPTTSGQTSEINSRARNLENKYRLKRSLDRLYEQEK